MSDLDTRPPKFNEGTPMPGSGMRWGLPIGLAAAILIIATIIFSAAGPDRTRTAANSNLDSKPVTAEQAKPESAIPRSSGDPSAAKQQTPARSNPAGTQ